MVGQVEYEAHPVRPPLATVASLDASYMVARLRRISWGAVFAGIAVSLMTHLLLSLLGLGIGLSAVDHAQAQIPDAGTLGTTAGIWWAVSGILAALIGGWVAARASGVPSRGFGAIHGLVTWAVTTLLVFAVLGSVVGGALNGLFTTASRMVPEAAVAGSQADRTPGRDVIAEARDLIGAAVANPDQVGDVMGRALSADATPQDREAAITLLTQQGGLTRPEAEARLEQWRGAYQQAAGTARNAAQTAAEVSSIGALAGFVALLLGAIAGALGGLWGSPREVLVEEIA
jgi:hypothetical protein